MDDELEQLEAELNRLQPVAMSKKLIARVERGITAPAVQTPVVSVRWLWWAALPAVAALAVAAILHGSKRAQRAAPILPQPGATQAVAAADSDDGSLNPIAAENLLVSARDEGLVTLDDGTQARRARLRYVDTITWQNPRTHASMTWRVPGEEVRVI